MIRREDLDEVWAVLLRFVPTRAAGDELLAALEQTRAYRADRGFRETLDQLRMHGRFPQAKE